MALAGVDALKELEVYDMADTGVLELCGKAPSDVKSGLSLWRNREPSRLSLMVSKPSSREADLIKLHSSQAT